MRHTEVNAGGYVVLGSSLGPRRLPPEPTETVADTSGTVATILMASAGCAVATGGGGASLGGTDSMAEAVPVAAVPEPSTFVLLGVAAVGPLGYVRRRRRVRSVATGDGGSRPCRK